MIIFRLKFYQFNRQLSGNKIIIWQDDANLILLHIEEIYDLNEPANERVEADREPILEEYEADYAEETDKVNL